MLRAPNRKKAGVSTGLATKTLKFEKLPKERSARGVLLNPLKSPGVLHVISHLPNDSLEVVGVAGKVDFDAVKADIDKLVKELEAEAPSDDG